MPETRNTTGAFATQSPTCMPLSVPLTISRATLTMLVAASQSMLEVLHYELMHGRDSAAPTAQALETALADAERALGATDGRA